MDCFIQETYGIWVVETDPGLSFGACLSTRRSGIDEQESVGGLCMGVLSNMQWLLKVLGPYRQRPDIQIT